MRTDRNGFALVGALLIALLFFLLVSVLLTDLVRVTRTTATSRSRVIAESLAESGAEVAARHMMLGLSSDFRQEFPVGEYEASWKRYPAGLPQMWRFRIEVTSRTKTAPPHQARLTIDGMYRKGELRIDHTQHTSTAATQDDDSERSE